MSETSSTPRRPTGSLPDLREFLEHAVGAVLVVCALFTLLGYMYLAGTADPQAHMRHMPVAVVDQDTGATLDTPAGPQRLHVGRDLVGGLMDNNDWSRIDLSVVDRQQAEDGLRQARYYAVVLLPPDLSTDVAGLLDGTTRSTGPAANRGRIEVLASPRLSLASGPVAGRLADGMQRSVDERMGVVLRERAGALAEARGTPLTATAAAALASPVEVRAGQWNPLPDGVSNSTLPMFWALVVVLAGFTGAMVISNLLDARLGFLPIELGPLSLAMSLSPHGRLKVLCRKWAITTITAPLVSAILLLLAHGLGIGGFSYWHTFWFSVAGVIAVGFCAHAVIAATGTAGLLVNLIVFVVLGIPTSGGATPPEMLPGFFRVIGAVEPMHQVYVGLRSIIFFDSYPQAGLTHAVTVLTLWFVLGVVGGLAITSVYDRIGMHRQHVERRVEPGDLRRRVAGRRGGQSRSVAVSR